MKKFLVIDLVSKRISYQDAMNAHAAVNKFMRAYSGFHWATLPSPERATVMVVELKENAVTYLYCEDNG